MTKSYLLPYNCTRCGTLRRMWYEVVDDIDKQIINEYYESDNAMITLNDLLDNEVELLCIKCRKHQDLMAYAL